MYVYKMNLYEKLRGRLIDELGSIQVYN